MPAKKKTSTKKTEAKSKASNRGRAKAKKMDKTSTKVKTASKAKAKNTVRNDEPVRVVNRISPPRTQSSEDRKSRSGRSQQYNYMKAPGIMYDFQVGDKVEVFCDHEKGRERVRGWIAGIVVQVDNKMVAVQFRSNVYLTDGWMVPDRILWYSLSSEHIRSLQGRKSSAKKEKVKVIPDY
jgi:hypothetical protein